MRSKEELLTEIRETEDFEKLADLINQIERNDFIENTRTNKKRHGRKFRTEFY